jgi:hypothetical protein
MNRKDFFKRLGIGAAAVIATPSILADIKVPEDVVTLSIYHDGVKIAEAKSYKIEYDCLTTLDDGEVFYG